MDGFQNNSLVGDVGNRGRRYETSKEGADKQVWWDHLQNFSQVPLYNTEILQLGDCRSIIYTARLFDYLLRVFFIIQSCP